MIIPNKFIPLLKESSLLKSRSKNDVSEFLKPKLFNEETGKTRQSLMNAMGMNDGSPTMGLDSMSMGQIAGMPNMENKLLSLADNDRFGKVPDGMPGAINDQMPSINGIGGIGGMNGGMEGMNGGMIGMSGGIEGMNGGMQGMNGGGMQGMNGGMEGTNFGNLLNGLNENNAINSMSNVGSNGMLSAVNQLPSGGDTQSFGPGGFANTDVLAMMNQIVGKEMPSDSPINPASKSEQLWNVLQKSFNKHKEVAQSKTNSQARTNLHSDQQFPISTFLPTNNPSSSSPITANPNIESVLQNQRSVSPIYNLTRLSKASLSTKATNEIKSVDKFPSTAEKNIPMNLSNKNIQVASTTVKPTESFVDKDQPLSDDMVKFLKGIKFVVSQESGSDVILGKTLSNHRSSILRSVKEENAAMKNFVSSSKMNHHLIKDSPENLKTINAFYKQVAHRARLLKRIIENEDKKEYLEAANVLEKTARLLKDSVAKKSAEIAIASIRRVLKLRNYNRKHPASEKNDLSQTSGIHMTHALSQKFLEAARVLATARNELTDPVAKKVAEIGIACIFKVIILNQRFSSKKYSVSLNIIKDDVADLYLRSISGQFNRKNMIAAREVAQKLKIVSNVQHL